MGQERSEERKGGGLRQRMLAWTKRPLRFELSCENLTWVAVALGVVLRVWEYLDFRPLYMDEVALSRTWSGGRSSISSRCWSRTRWLRRGFW